jgi:alpha-beta hydrolase superfamily lysophospholipase
MNIIVAMQAETDYSMETLTADVLAVAAQIYGSDVATWPKIVLVGHSMGGAIAAHIAASNKLPNLAAVVVKPSPQTNPKSFKTNLCLQP